MHRTITLHGVLLIGVLILVILGQASDASAGTNVWTSAGSGGGVIHVLAIDPDNPENLFAGTEGNGVLAIHQEDYPAAAHLPLVVR
jgi:hypothetical protein